MLIRWHGHACFEISNAHRIVVVPHDGRSIGLKPPRVKADIVLITHDHFDHNATRVISGNFEVIRSPGEHSFPGLFISGYEAYHDEVQGAKRGKVTIYKITMEGISILHTGDLGHILPASTVERIGKVDILMIPVGGVYTVDARGAYENVKLLKPRIVIPMHYRLPGLSLSLNPVDEFLKLFPEGSIYHVGTSVDVSKEDIPEKTEVWVFSL